MRDAFGVEREVSKSFSGGTWKPITRMTGHELSGIKGSHAAAQGISHEDQRALLSWQKYKENSTAHNPVEVVRNRRGGRVAREEPVEGGKQGTWKHNFPSPGESQRSMPQRIIAPKKGSSLRHELEHTSRRKPASATVRLVRNPEKLWGDEARADSVMSAKRRARSAYLYMAQGKLKPDRYWGPNNIYPKGLKQGGDKKYLKVRSRIADAKRSRQS